MMIKKGMQVKIISGKDKGKTGEILEIDRKLKRLKIKSINMIHQSNVKNVDQNKKEKKMAGKK